MALNWVMISSDGKNPVPLPSEKILFSQEKVSLLLDLGGGYPGNPSNYKADGNIFITNQRVLFISRPPLHNFQSLSVPILNLKDGKLQQPWFGANYYEAYLMPVQNGGLPSPGQLKITFKEGGGYDFSSCFTELIQRLSESESYVLVEHTEQLPTYTPREDSTSTATQALGTAASSGVMPPTGPLTNATSPSHSTLVNSAAPPPIAPGELPPSYDEVTS
ncbi:15168_t:CDS:2 [Cetraspora pellucida]|uniref:15168_t:CDS:1 n=1 Tax=Cetraspora pellucida TaxID=1433469 RepID=A0A9N8ZF62_9GLOM|nr:15168_t:CDS:2 [Cetraspora pellucida]